MSDGVKLKHGFGIGNTPEGPMGPQMGPGPSNMDPMVAQSKIFIGTPAYNSMVHSDYMHSIIDYYRNGLGVTVMTIGNESLIPRGRNTVLSYFYHMKEFTHLAFIDADIFLDFPGIHKLLSHGVDVIGAPVALKGFGPEGQPVYNVGQMLEKVKEDLLSVDRVGTAVLILSRNAVESLVEDAIANDQVYDPNPHSRGDADPTMHDHYNVFGTGVINREYDSEDFFVCRKLRDLGHTIHIDPTVRVRHNGMFVFM